tara:strand:+ start:4497 stop:5096 length:600 start_codon:yes stop_codon:yes gene_type:complete
MSYIGTQPNDVIKNIGLYTPSEILQLTKDGSWGGSLELIQSQSVSGATTCNFTSIKENIYDVHLLQLDDLESASQMYSEIRLSNDGGSSYETANYQRAVQYGGTNGSFGGNDSTSADRFTILNISNANEPQSLYVYLYSLGSSSKYSFITHHAPPSNIYMYYGNGAYAVAETINAIQVLNSAGASFTGGTAKLYGLKQL